MAERWDDLGDGFGMWQEERSYRFGMDSVLLAHFAVPRPRGRVLDLGAGDGVIALLLAAHTDVREIVCVENRADAADRARRSVARNGLDGRIAVCETDIQSGQLSALGFFDMVVCNPPYYTAAQGMRSPNVSLALSRCQLGASLGDFVRVASARVQARGRFCVIYPAETAASLFGEMTRYRLEPKRAVMVHPGIGKPPRWIMAEGVRDAKPGIRWEVPILPDGRIMQGG